MGIKWEDIQELVDDDDKLKSYKKQTENKIKESQIKTRNENNADRINNVSKSISRNVLPTAQKSFLKNPAQAKRQEKPELTYKDFMKTLLPTVADKVARKTYGDDLVNIFENTGLGVYNGILHSAKGVQDNFLETGQNELKMMKEVNEKFGISGFNYDIQQNNINKISNSIEKKRSVINNNNEIIQRNIDNSSNFVTQALSDLANPIGETLPGLALRTTWCSIFYT